MAEVRAWDQIRNN